MENHKGLILSISLAFRVGFSYIILIYLIKVKAIVIQTIKRLQQNPKTVEILTRRMGSSDHDDSHLITKNENYDGPNHKHPSS